MHKYQLGRVSAIVFTSSMLSSGSALAGQGSLSAPLPGETYGRMNLSANFRFPPTTAQIENVKTGFRMASRILCDTTEGKVRIKQVTLNAGGSGESAADLWILDDSATPRSFSPGIALTDAAGNFTDTTGFTSGAGVHVNIYYPNVPIFGGTMFAHELMHYSLTVSDEYQEIERDHSPCSHGAGLDDPFNVELGEDGVAPAMTEVINSLAQRNPNPECQFLDATGAWVPRGVSCFQDSDCTTANPGDRCFSTLASELNMSEQYFDTQNGEGVLGDCPPPRASDTVYLVGASGSLVKLGDAAAINTDDFATKTFDQAKAASVMSTEVELIDDAGVYVGLYDRSSQRLMLYYQKRAADLWRVWVGFDANKMPGGNPDADPVLAIVGSFDLEINRGKPGCGDGTVQANLDEECDVLPGSPPQVTTCNALDPGSAAISTNSISCNPATCTWDRTGCTWTNTPTLIPGIFETCGDGIVQTSATSFPPFPTNRLEQCEAAIGPTTVCQGTGTTSCTSCLNDPGTCTHTPAELPGIKVNNGNPIQLTIPLGTHAFPKADDPYEVCKTDADCPGRVCHKDRCSNVYTPSTLNLTVVTDRDANGKVDIVTDPAVSDPAQGAVRAHQDKGFGACGEVWGNVTCSRYWKGSNPADPRAGNFLSTRQRIDNKSEYDWQTAGRLYPWMTKAGDPVNGVQIGGASRPLAETPGCIGGETDPANVNFVQFTENLTPTDQVYVVLDVSGSMSTEDGSDGKQRIEDAQASADLYLKTQASLGGLDVGLIKFSSTPSCYAPGADACALTTVNAGNIQSLQTAIDALTPGGSTAIGDAMDLARQQFAAHGDPAKHKTIYLLTDGHHNAGTLSPADALKLIPPEIKVITVGFGEADNKLLEDISRVTQGYSMSASTSDQLGSILHEIAAREHGHSLAVPRTELEASSEIITRSTPSVSFDINPGSRDLTVVLTARDQKTWAPGVRLAAPDGTIYTTGSPQVSVRPNAFALIQIPTPLAGSWTLTTTSSSGTQKSYATASVNDPPARCFVSASPAVVADGSRALVRPTVTYAADLDPNTVFVSGKLRGPGGFEAPLSFHAPGPQGEPSFAEVPASQLNGRGSYTVEVTCRTNSASKTARGDTITGTSNFEVAVQPFEYKATTTFFLDSTTMPACGTNPDCDGDGIPNTAEGITGGPGGTPIDTDGDGYPDAYDRDSDNDDVPDDKDNCRVFSNPSQTVSAPVFSPLSSLAITTCSTTGNTTVAVPQATDMCGVGLTAQGTIISSNGQTTQQPFNGGVFNVQPGQYVIRWTVTDSRGLTSNVDQTVVVDGCWPMYGRTSSHDRQSPFKGPSTNVRQFVFTGSTLDIKSSPAIAADGTVYVGSDTHRVYAISSNGQLKWQRDTGANVRTSPAIGLGGFVYVANDLGKLFKLDPANGNVLCSVSLGGIPAQSSAAIGSDGTVYIGSDDDRLYAIDQTSCAVKWTVKTGADVDSSPAVLKQSSGDVVFVGSDDRKLYAIDATTHQVLWTFTTGGQVNSSPALSPDGSAVYVGSDDDKVYAISVSSHQKLWERNLNSDVQASPAIGASGTVYVGSLLGDFFALNPSTGAVLWTRHLQLAVSSAAVDANEVVFVGSDDTVYALGGNTGGSVIWSYKTGANVRSSPAIGVTGTVYVGSDDDKLYAFGPGQTLGARWEAPAPTSSWSDWFTGCSMSHQTGRGLSASVLGVLGLARALRRRRARHLRL